MVRAFECVLDHPKTVVSAWAFFAVVMALSLTHVKYSSDNRAFFAENNEDLILLQQMEMKYSHTNQLLVVFHTDAPSFVQLPHLKNALLLHNRLWQIPFVTRVDSVVNYKDLSGTAAELSSDNFISARSLAAQRPSVGSLKSTLKDPAVRNRLISDDLKTIGYVVTVNLPEVYGDDPVRRITTDMKEVAREFSSRHESYEVYVSGTVALMATFGEAALRDMQRLVPFALIVASLVIILLLGSITEALGLLLATVVSALGTTGIWAWSGHAFNTATSVAPIIVMTLCLAAGLHIIIAIRTAPGTNKKSRIAAGLSLTKIPSALALVTTLVSFLAFLGAKAPPLQEMGLMVCSGLVIAYGAIYTLMPAIMLWTLKLSRRRPLIGAKRLVNRQSLLAGICIGVFALSLPGLFRLTLDEDFSAYFDQSFDYRRSVDFADAHLMGQTELHVDLPHPQNGDVTEPEYVEAVSQLVEHLRAHPSVTTALSFVDPLQRVAAAIPERHGELPDSQAALAEYLLMYELSLEQGESLADFISIDRTSSRVVILLAGLGSSGIQQFIEEFKQHASLEGYFQAVSVFGLSQLFADLSERNIKGMISTTVASISVIAIVIAALFRAASYGIACLTLGLVPLITGFGLWGWFHAELGLAGAVIVGVTIGVLIDDCIHFIHKYRQSRANHSHDEAASYAFSTAGAAILITSIALISGFAMLCFSGFLINAQLGLFSCLVFALALFYCLGLLPWLLKMVVR